MMEILLLWSFSITSHPVPAGTQMLLTMTLTPNGTLMVVVDDHGISPVTSHSMSLADLRHSNDT